MSQNDEVKWMTTRGTWRYIPDRYQALVATVVSALLYFNAFEVVFSDRSGGNCGSFLRPRLDSDRSLRGWFTHSLSGNDTYCGRGYFSNLQWEFAFTFFGLAICGLVLRRVIRRESNPVTDGVKKLKNRPERPRYTRNENQNSSDRNGF